jgi:hypothetical protein
MEKAKKPVFIMKTVIRYNIYERKCFICQRNTEVCQSTATTFSQLLKNGFIRTMTSFTESLSATDAMPSQSLKNWI